MREQWTDFEGKCWPLITSTRRLKFKYPAHAALRRHIFTRDNFTCARCEAHGVEIPANYDGRNTLFTNTFLTSGYRDVLVLDHKLTLRAGGKNHLDNFQTLCETCNRRKQKEDKAAIAAYRKVA